jgi:hypothetical protein
MHGGVLAALSSLVWAVACTNPHAPLTVLPTNTTGGALGTSTGGTSTTASSSTAGTSGTSTAGTSGTSGTTGGTVTSDGGRFACNLGDGGDGGMFGPWIQIPGVDYGPWGLSAFATGDLNGDGNLDLAEGNNYNGSLGILLGNGDGSFRAPVFYSAYSDPFSLYPNDVSVVRAGSPARQLLVVSSRNPAYMPISEGLYVGQVDDAGALNVVATLGGFEAFNALAVTLTRDGLIDLVGQGSSQVEEFLANDAGGWSSGTVVVLAPDAEPLGDFVGDFNEDGTPDILEFASDAGLLVIYSGNGDGTFSDAGLFTTLPTRPQWFHLADLNEDGHLDVFVQGSPSFILFGRGDGTFSLGPDVTLDGALVSDGFRDLNGDGHLDYLSLDGFNLFVGLGNGDGTFQPAIVLALPGDGGLGYAWVTVGDVNNDGRPDLITTQWLGGDINIFLNQCR